MRLVRAGSVAGLVLLVGSAIGAGPGYAASASLPAAHARPAAAEAVAAPTVTVTPDPINAATVKQVTVQGAATGVTVAISITDGSSTAPVTATATVVNGKYSKSAIDVSSLADGTLTVSVTTSDLTGATSPAATTTVTKDTVAPVTTLDVPTYITTSPTTVSGVTDPGATVTVKATDSGGALSSVSVTGTTKVPASGDWSLQLDTSGMAEGTITFVATPTDAAGNAGAAVTKTSTKDTTAPDAPATVKATPSPWSTGNFTVTGTTSANDGSDTADLTVDVTVTDVNGLSITSTGQPVTAPTGLSQAGTFSVPFGANQMNTLADGTLTISALFHDEAGNTGPATTATAEKGVLALVSTSPTNGSTVATPTTVSATYNENLSSTTATTSTSSTTSTITVTDSTGTAVPGATTITGTSISFKPTSALATGAYSVVVDAFDKATPSERSTNSFSFTVDPDAKPAAPVITTFTDPITASNEKDVVVSGTGVATDTVTVTIASLTRTATVDANGAWTTTFDVTSLPDGTLTASAVQSSGTTTSDAATQTSTKSTVVTGISLVASRGTLTAGQALTLSGHVTQSTKAAYGTVTLTATTSGGSTVALGTVPVAANGSYRATFKPSVDATYQATYGGDSANAAVASPKRLVKVAFALRASSPTGKHTEKARVTGSIAPGTAGTVVTLSKVVGGVKHKLATARVTKGHTFSFAVKLAKGKTSLLVNVAATANNAAGSYRFTAKRS